MISPSVTKIGKFAFSGTPWLIKQQEENSLVICNNILIDGSTCCGEIIIPNRVTSIADYAFSGCSSLTDITLPNNITKIGDGVFNRCESLTCISITDNITSIGDWAFSGCDSLTNIVIPSSVNYIDSYAFFNSDDITITTPKGSYAEEYAKRNGIPCIYNNLTAATKITLNKSTVHLNAEEKILLTATIVPSDATIRTVRWKSSDTSIAQVSSIGIVTAVSAGTATIRATTQDGSNLSATCTITVSDTEKSENPSGNNTTDKDIRPSKNATSQDGTTATSFFNNNNDSDEDNVKKVTIPKVTKVTKFKATAKNKGFTLSWKKVSGASGYKLQISTKKNFKGANTYTINKSKKKYTLSKLKEKTKYYIRICAYKTYKGEDGKTKKVYGKYVSVNKKTK